MNDYTELVKALRCDDCGSVECTNSECPYYGFGCLDGKMCKDAAAAIEALQAEQKKTVTQIFGEEQQEWEEYCTGLMNRIRELKAQLPKRGGWINHKDEHQCSVCRETVVVDEIRWEQIGAYDYCPNCGAKMGVQDESV